MGQSEPDWAHPTSESRLETTKPLDWNSLSRNASSSGSFAGAAAASGRVRGDYSHSSAPFFHS